MSVQFINTIRKHKRKPKPDRNLHCSLILMFFIFIITKISEFQNILYHHKQQPVIHQYKLQHIAIYIFIKDSKQNLIKNCQSERAIILLLLILSNDIHRNPGPNPVNPKYCTQCEEEASEEDSLECETCRNPCHIKCADVENDIYLHNSSFQWICPNLSCKPNHREGNHLGSLNTSNRFEELHNDTENIVEVQDEETATYDTIIENQSSTSNQLLQALPKISAKAYQGKELCRKCFKEVKMVQQAILCDICDRWSHRSCSDMSMKVYKDCKKKKHFLWSCNSCRTDETLNTDLIDITKLKEDEMPEDITKILSTDDELLIINMNCRSAVNKQEDIQFIIDKLKPDVLVKTETWYDDSVPANAYVPAGYKTIRKDRSDEFKQKYSKTRGGGIAIIYKEHLNIIKKDYMTDKIEEILWVQVRGKNSFMLGAIYRSEYTDLLDAEQGESKIEENIRKAAEISDRIIVTGDLNVDMSNANDADTQNLQNIYHSYGLTQLITKPTRIDKKSGRSTIIDHVWANSEISLVKSTGTFVGVSDHLATYMKLNVKKPEVPIKYIKHRNYKRYSSEAFKESLSDRISHSSIEQHITHKDVNAATEELVQVMQQSAEEHAPMKITKIMADRNKIPWYTDELRNKIAEKNELISDFHYYGSRCFKTRIKIMNNQISHLKRKLKKKYLTQKIKEAQGDAKKCWKVLDQVTHRTKTKDTTEPEMMNQEQANKHNHYFATVGSEIQKKLNVNLPNNNFRGLTGFNFIPETPENIGKLIDKIREDVATGHDEIGARLIKDAKDIITPIITKIVNIGYETSTFPNCMKHATIKAVHKKNDPEDISNYRPISILPTLSKVFERAATDQLVNYLEKNNLISNNQHAYRKGHSTNTCLFEVLNYLYKLVDQKRHVAVVSLDLSKAFDTINLSLILQKLSKMNCSENTLSWVESYLTNRSQRTKFQSFISQEEQVTSGVPQGSILGPLLFLCFTNDLAAAVEHKCKMVAYADDTQLIVDAKNEAQLKTAIEEIIQLAQTWYTQNSMKNNIGKTEILVVNNNQPNMEIRLNDEGEEIVVKTKPVIKILGVLIDEKLNWEKQINNVKKKSLNTMRSLHRVNHLLPLKEKINLYNSLLTPQFDYADIIWGGCSKQNSNKLQIVQNFAAKSITGNKKYDSATASLKKLKFLTLQQRRTIHEAKFAHKSILQQNPKNINSDFQQFQPTSNTRFSKRGKLNLPKHKTSKYENSPLYRSIKSWNSIPDHITSENPTTLKNNFQKYLIQQSYNQI